MPSYRSLRNLGLGVAAAIPLSLATSQQAQAVPYAYASNVDTNFAITAVSGGTYTPSAGNFITQNAISSAGAGLTNPSSTSGLGTGFSSSDAAQVYSGAAAAPAENTFTQALTGVTAPALRADSFDSGFNGAGGTVAEGNFQSAAGGAFGTAQGKLNSNNTSTITVTVGAGTVLNVSFNDSVGLQAITRALASESAAAAISSSVSIQNAAGAVVFTFTPDGTLTATTGGTTQSDPYNLNTTVAASGGGSNNTSFFQSGGLFSANTNALAAGTYTININQAANINLVTGTAATVPEPASLALLGAGLMGFGVLRRKRKAD